MPNIKKRLSAVLAIAFFFASAPVLAETMVATGRSAVQGDITEARDAALSDAIKNALRQSGSHVDSATNLHNGMLDRDLVQLRATGKVTQVEILDEQTSDGVYSVTIRADVGRADSCSAAPHQGLRKTAVFTLFPRIVPQSSRVGQLGDVDAQLPRELARRLYPAHNVLVQAADTLRIDSDSRLLTDTHLMAQAAQQVARTYNTQYVVSGSVVDMSLIHPHKYPQGAVSRAATYSRNTVGSWFGKAKTDNRERNFGFRVVVHDGLTGDTIFDKAYNGTGIWNAKFAEVTGFGSPRFWQTHYGSVADQLINRAVSDLGQKLDCQPFMVEAEAISTDNAIYLPAGANQGVSVGSTFELYAQTIATVPSQALSYYNAHAAPTVKRLQSEGSLLTVTQTYPGYSLATTQTKLNPNKQYIAVSR